MGNEVSDDCRNSRVRWEYNAAQWWLNKLNVLKILKCAGKGDSMCDRNMMHSSGNENVECCNLVVRWFGVGARIEWFGARPASTQPEAENNADR